MPRKKKTAPVDSDQQKEPIKVVIDETDETAEETTSSEVIPSDSKKPSRRNLIIIVTVLAVVLLSLVGVVAWQKTHPANFLPVEKKLTHKKKKAETSTTAARHSDGMIVAKADANKVPACVMIENAAFDGVRPQAGLSAASVVYEVIVEGGITRLMAVYAGETADKIGPVRSARDTYLEFASEYNCAYAHAGGSYTAMLAIPRFNMRNVDALYDGTWFWRDNAKYSPHNLFTSSDNLDKAINDGHSWKDEPVYAVWNFVDDNALPTDTTATTVSIAFGGSYDVLYQYNADDKNYERTNGGALQTDSNTGKTLTARNIIVQHVPPGIFIEGKGRVNFSVTGEGEVEIVRNGVITKGTWKKADRLDRTRFFDDANKEIPLARGNTWVEIVPEGTTVEVK
ncbi:MAG: DUF3048 domain-containing protein [Patescibacteria group bacterium]|jgi:hypothetical protein